MKKITNDMTRWQLRQENLSRPFPYCFPQIPPRFRRCCGLIRALFLAEWSCTFALVLGSAAAAVVALSGGTEALLEGRMAFFIAVAIFALMPLGILCRWLRNTPKFFWHCPCCGQPFPYYAPPRLRGMDILKEDDCLDSMEHLRIPYVKMRFCPLIVPSVCPECRCRFFSFPSK